MSLSLDPSTGFGLLEGGETTQTQSNNFNPTVKPLAEAGVEGLLNTSTPTYFPGQTVAPQSANTVAGIDGLSAAAGTQNTIAGQTAGGLDFTMNNMLDPATNQALQAYMAAAINPVFDRLENQTLTGIGGDAIQAGQFGGTAQTNLTRDALTDAQRTAGDITAGIASNAYTTSLDNYTNTLLNAGRVQDQQVTGADTLLAAGNMEDVYNQSLVNANIDRHNFDQTAALDYYTQLLNTASAVPMNATTVQSGGSTSPFNAALSTYGMYKMFS